MSQKPSGGRASASYVIAGGLLIGIMIILALVYMRKTEREAPSAATNLALQKLGDQEIQQWIVEKMQSEQAKIGIVNIWATWCEPCRAEMPELAKFQKTKQAPLFLISADGEVDEAGVRSFLVQSGVDFESVLIRGNQQEFVENWQRRSSKDLARQWSMTLPATFLVNASGQVISFAVGTSTAAELSDLVKKSLDTAHD